MIPRRSSGSGSCSRWARSCSRWTATQEAYEDYQKLLQEFPDYPDKLAICRKLLPLAQKLDKKADAEQYEAEINRLSPPPPQSPPKT